MEIRVKDASGRELMFNPARDITHFWPYLIAAAVPGLEPQHWDDAIRKVVGSTSLRETDLMLVLVRFVRFCERAFDPAVKTPLDALNKVGFFQSPPEARAAFFYRLGVLSAGVWFDAIRRIVPEGSYHEEMEALIRAANEMAEELKKRGISVDVQSEPEGEADAKTQEKA